MFIVKKFQKHIILDSTPGSTSKETRKWRDCHTMGHQSDQVTSFNVFEKLLTVLVISANLKEKHCFVLFGNCFIDMLYRN